MNTQTDAEQIQQLIEKWAAGARKGALEVVMSCYAPDVVAFDAILALQFSGVDAYRRHWQTCMEFMAGGEMVLEVHDLNVAVDGNVAFAHYLSRCGGCDADGKEQTGWMRATVCCRKLADGWRIAHEHYSVPFDPETMNAMTALEP
jgi:uncharacterized protein (TIGR02246 family)